MMMEIELGQMTEPELIELMHQVTDELEARLMQSADVRQN